MCVGDSNSKQITNPNTWVSDAHSFQLLSNAIWAEQIYFFSESNPF